MLCAVQAKLNLIRTILESRSDFAFMPSASNPKPLFNKRGERANKLQLIAILTHFHVTHRSTGRRRPKCKISWTSSKRGAMTKQLPRSSTDGDGGAERCCKNSIANFNCVYKYIL